MKEKIIFYLKKLPFYFIGMNILAISILFIKRSPIIGSAGWDAVNINLTYLTKISLGTASIIVNAILLLIVLIYRRDLKYLLIVITILVLGLVIDFWDLIVLKNLVAPNNYYQILFFVIGMIFLPLGLSLIIFSKFPQMIFDQFTFMLMDIFKTKNFSVVRIGLEVFSVILGVVIGLLAKLPFDYGIGAVGIGTIIAAFILGPMINFYLNTLKKLFKENEVNKEIAEEVIEE